jgi:hypothetical protein
VLFPATCSADIRVRSQLSTVARFPHLLTIGIATLRSGLPILLLGSGAPYVVARRRRETPPPERLTRAALET